MFRPLLLTALLLGYGLQPAYAATAVVDAALQASLTAFFAAQPSANHAVAKLVDVQRWPNAKGAMRWSLPTLRFLPKRISLIAEQGQGKSLRRWYVSVHVKWMADVVTLKEDISARTVLDRSMLTQEHKDIAGLRGQTWHNISDTVGLKSLRNLRSGEVVLPAQFVRPPLIQRGDQVTILVEVGGLKIRVAGIALKSGNRGERMLVQNIRSKQMLQSTVQDAHTVAVFLGGV